MSSKSALQEPRMKAAIAILFLSLATPLVAQSGTVASGPAEAGKMVPAQAALKENLDEKKLQTGALFHATLAKKVHLANGFELPSGTVLVGEIAADDMSIDGTSKLALRFTTAHLKNGQDVPIKATIVTVVKPELPNNTGFSPKPGDQLPNEWNDHSTHIDQINVTKGVDLHSAVSSSNSGVFVANDGRDVKIATGSELALAIAPR